MNMLYESGLPTIEQRKDFVTAQLLSKLHTSSNSTITTIAKQNMKRIKTPRCPSTINQVISFAEFLDLPFAFNTPKEPAYPPWFLPKNSIITDLTKLPKETTSKELYKSTFIEKTATYKEDGWYFIYTDGTKNQYGTAFAIVDEAKNILRKGILPGFSSVLSAEATAILTATKLNNKQKTIIFSDSLSTLIAVKNISNNSPTIQYIRDQLIVKKEKLKLFWVPGHAGIIGNEFADEPAKQAPKEPLLMSFVPNKKDISKMIKTFFNG